MNYSVSATQLLEEQKLEWELVKTNFEALENVTERIVQFEGFSMIVQFNPARIISATAKIDTKTVAERKCILCAENRPQVQRGIDFENNYWILCNPFPIFKQHFTIANKLHTKQLIDGRFDDMLRLAHAMQGFTIIYNGPRCGASTPEHFHFQAGEFGFMVLDTEFETVKKIYGDTLYSTNSLQISAIDDGFRKFIAVESTDIAEAEKSLNRVYATIHQQHNADEEPRMNVITNYVENKWRTLIFVRDKHRPHEFDAEGDARIVVSPGSVEMGGIIITPIEKDFHRLTVENLRSIFTQVSAKNQLFENIKMEIRKSYQ